MSKTDLNEENSSAPREEILPSTHDPNREESKEFPGLMIPKGGLRRITDWQAFVDSLPDFGEDGVRLTEAILEDRKLRRALTEKKE